MSKLTGLKKRLVTEQEQKDRTNITAPTIAKPDNKSDKLLVQELTEKSNQAPTLPTATPLNVKDAVNAQPFYPVNSPPTVTQPGTVTDTAKAPSSKKNNQKQQKQQKSKAKQPSDFPHPPPPSHDPVYPPPHPHFYPYPPPHHRYHHPHPHPPHPHPPIPPGLHYVPPPMPLSDPRHPEHIRWRQEWDRYHHHQQWLAHQQQSPGNSPSVNTDSGNGNGETTDKADNTERIVVKTVPPQQPINATPSTAENTNSKNTTKNNKSQKNTKKSNPVAPNKPSFVDAVVANPSVSITQQPPIIPNMTVTTTKHIPITVISKPNNTIDVPVTIIGELPNENENQPQKQQKQQPQKQQQQQPQKQQQQQQPQKQQQQKQKQDTKSNNTHNNNKNNNVTNKLQQSKPVTSSSNSILFAQIIPTSSTPPDQELSLLDLLDSNDFDDMSLSTLTLDSTVETSDMKAKLLGNNVINNQTLKGQTQQNNIQHDKPLHDQLSFFAFSQQQMQQALDRADNGHHISQQQQQRNSIQSAQSIQLTLYELQELEAESQRTLADLQVQQAQLSKQSQQEQYLLEIKRKEQQQILKKIYQQRHDIVREDGIETKSHNNLSARQQQIQLLKDQLVALRFAKEEGQENGINEIEYMRQYDILTMRPAKGAKTSLSYKQREYEKIEQSNHAILQEALAQIKNMSLEKYTQFIKEKIKLVLLNQLYENDLVDQDTADELLVKPVEQNLDDDEPKYVQATAVPVFTPNVPHTAPKKKKGQFYDRNNSLQGLMDDIQ